MLRWIEVGPALAVIAAVTVGGCTQTRETPTVTQDDSPSPPPTPKAADRSSEATLESAEIESLALACDGVTLATLGTKNLAKLDPSALSPSASLLVTWESARAFTSDGTLKPAAASTFVDAVTKALGQAPPKWWSDQLATAKRQGGTEPPFYDVGRTERGDRRGAWQEGPGKLQVRPGGAGQLTAQDGRLAYDFSMGRAELGPLPTEPGTALEHTRAHAGSTVYFATFPVAAGGFPFPLHAVTSGGQERWTAEVCGPKRTALDGIGHLTVELAVLQDPPKGGLKMTAAAPPRGLAVFTAETHGVALEVFDVETGKRTLAWSSDVWFSRT